MAHFAELNENNYVIRVVKVGNDIPTSNGPLGENDMHPDGEAWCVNFFKGGVWKQTSFNYKFRNIYAVIGGKYDPINDEFLPEKPYNSWLLSDNKKYYKAPIENPVDLTNTLPDFRPLTSWDEVNLRWIGTEDNGQTIYAWNPTTLTWSII
jgi:hypothetical protein